MSLSLIVDTQHTTAQVRRRPNKLLSGKICRVLGFVSNPIYAITKERLPTLHNNINITI